MRIPEPLFKIVNLIVRALLASPLHGLASGSFMVIQYKGRKSGRDLATPVRYQRIEGVLRATTAEHTQWWRNVQANPEVALRVAGEVRRYRASLVVMDPERARPMLLGFLAEFPQDAVYQDIRMDKDNQPDPADLEAALKVAVIVDFEPIAG
ncbi:MAG: nitroreductase family deazaflavin-dependent oxidoreductase [Halioglobus sp.]|nr:nitroreductase family deazaflavin-dependent oxidoreductase [Halioglobus sp.]